MKAQGTVCKLGAIFGKGRSAFGRTTSVLSLGANTKNTVCFLENGLARVSPVHRDLRDPADFFSFEKTVKAFLTQKPAIIAYDLHPEYISTKYVHDLSPTTYHLRPIQHHHAHIAACMAENNIQNEFVIGVAFDGTGVGTDGHIWGAEFLVCDYRKFTRAAHLKEIPLVGFDQAIRQPWRLGAAWLSDVYGERFLRLSIGACKRIPSIQWGLLEKMHAAGFAWPRASSMGRLFDAVGFMVFANANVRFEGELAVALEQLAIRARCAQMPYDFAVHKSEAGHIVDPGSMFRQIVADLQKDVARQSIALRFHHTVARMTSDTCLLLRKQTGIRRVVLSGGVFQNKLLLKLVLDLLYKHNFTAVTHTALPCNDACVSLGQAVIAGCQR